MSDLAPTIRRRPRRALFVCAALFAISAPALVWIGRSSAGPATPAHPATVSKAFANVPTGKADAVDVSDDIPCTVSPNYTDMPGMSATFKLGGAAGRPVLVLMQGQWFLPNDGVTIRIRLVIDGVVQSGSTDVLVAERPTGVALVDGTHGFNFVSDALTPGTHTAKIQWHDNGVNFGCIANRSLIVMHK
jgi:hypothetical protein